MGLAFRLERYWSAPLLLALCATAVGCGGSDATKQQLSALEAEVNRLQNRADRLEERLTGVERARLAAAPAKTLEATPRTTEERPPLKVIRLQPDDSEGGPDPKGAANGKTEAGAESGKGDQAPRPLIRIQGRDEGEIHLPESRRSDEPGEQDAGVEDELARHAALPQNEGTLTSCRGMGGDGASARRGKLVRSA